MWLLIPLFILFYGWPALVALALWLVWKRAKKSVFKRMAFWMIGVEVLWVMIVVINGIVNQ